MQAHTSFRWFSIAALTLAGACASSADAAPSPLTAPGASLTGSVDCDAAIRAFAADSHVAVDPDDPQLAALRGLVATADGPQAAAGCTAGIAAFAAAQRRPRGTIDGTWFYAAHVKVDLAWGAGNTLAGELDVRTCD